MLLRYLTICWSHQVDQVSTRKDICSSFKTKNISHLTWFYQRTFTLNQYKLEFPLKSRRRQKTVLHMVWTDKNHFVLSTKSISMGMLPKEKVLKSKYCKCLPHDINLLPSNKQHLINLRLDNIHVKALKIILGSLERQWRYQNVCS